MEDEWFMSCICWYCKVKCSFVSTIAVLVLYFRYFLLWDDDLATSIYHTFVALCYLTPILGAIVADSWLGKYKWVAVNSNLVFFFTWNVVFYVVILAHVLSSFVSLPLLQDNHLLVYCLCDRPGSDGCQRSPWHHRYGQKRHPKQHDLSCVGFCSIQIVIYSNIQ